MYKLIVIDLDGTLLNNNLEIPQNTINYLNSLLKKDYKLVLASGRPKRSILNYSNMFIKPIFLISENGAHIELSDGSKSLDLKQFDLDQFILLFKNNKDIIKNAFFSVDDKLYIYNRIPKLEPFYNIDSKTKVIEGPFDEIKDIKSPNGAMFIINSLEKNKFEGYINKSCQIKYRLLGQDMKNAIYEISLADLDKSKALIKILDYYNISKDDVIAFGDGDNDIEMLKMVGMGVAMINSQADVRKEIKNLTIYDNNNEGVYHKLTEIIKMNE